MRNTTVVDLALASPPSGGGHTAGGNPFASPFPETHDALVRSLAALALLGAPGAGHGAPAAGGFNGGGSGSAVTAAGTMGPTSPVAPAGTTSFAPPALPAGQKPSPRLAPTDPPISRPDNVGNNVLYIARAVTSTAEPAVYNVSADAGVQANDSAINANDILISSLVGHPIPANGGTTTGTTAAGGTIKLHSDGSFSYVPALGFTGEDTFEYVDTEILQGTSSATPVSIFVTPQSATPFFTGAGAGSAVTLETGAGSGTTTWAKFHNTTDNAGIGTASRFNRVTALFSPSLSYPVEGSPVTGFANGAPTVFVHNDSNVTALGAFNGTTVWNTSFTTGKVDVAPAVVSTTASGPGTDFLVTGSSAPLPAPNSGNVLALDANSGAVAGQFLARETYTTPGNITYSNLIGPVKTSPTVLTLPSTPTDPTGLSAVVVGTDGQQGQGTSGGRLYALRPDGTLAWETLVANRVDTAPLVAPPSLLDPDGAVYITAASNLWGGRPDAPSSGGDLRLYKLNAATGEIMAEMFFPDLVSGSATFRPGAAGTADPSGADASIFFATDNGTIRAVSPVLTATPPSGIESLSLTPLWSFQGNPHPTTPALSVDNATIYIGDLNGVRALPVTGAGTSGWFSAVGQVPAAPAVVPDETTPGASQVIVGANPAGQSVVRALLDTGTAPTTLWSFGITPPFPTLHFGLSAPAIGPVGPPVRLGHLVRPGQAMIYIGSTDGTILGLD